MRISWIIPVSKMGWFWLMFRMLFVVILPISWLLWYMIKMPSNSYMGVVTSATSEERELADRMLLHVSTIASTEHNTQNPLALAYAASYIKDQLASMGYSVAIQAFDVRNQKVENIEVEIKGSKAPSEIIVIGAHYDSARGSPGANDNGSGTSMLIELARYFKHSKPENTLRFVFFVNEEPPYFGSDQMGSLVYADRSRERAENIRAMVSLETIGYYDDAPGSQKYPIIFKPFFPSEGNFIAFVGDFSSRNLVHDVISTFRSAQKFPSQGIATYSRIQGIDWSDHSSFWKNDYLALMVTDTAIFRYPFYHTINDTPDKLNYIKMAKVFGGLHAVVSKLAGSHKQLEGLRVSMVKRILITKKMVFSPLP